MTKSDSPGRKPLKGLDRKDLMILTAFGQLGGKVSAEELKAIVSKELKAEISDRTIRFRIKRLRDEGYLSQLYAMTHELKLGLGDSILILQESDESTVDLKKALESVPWFYYQGPTYGKFNGYMIHAMYSVDDPNGVKRIADALVETGLAESYYYFENLDYESRRGDFTYFDYEKGWNWDFAQWIRESEACIASGDSVEINLDENQQPIEFDEIDVLLSSEMKVESKRTLREFGDIVGLSETQVKRRIDHLEEMGIIKGYRWILQKIEQPLFIYFFIELTENIDCVLSAFYRLPFPGEIMMDSRTKYNVRVRIHGTEMTGLLRGMTQMRKYMDSYFVQIVHDIDSIPSNYPSQFFDKKTLKYSFPVDDVVKRIKKKYG